MRSLKNKITIIIIFIILLFQGLFSFIKIFTEEKQIKNELIENQNRIIDELSESLVSPLWDLDIDRAKTLIGIKLKSRDFVGLIIDDHVTGEALIGIFKTTEGMMESFDVPKKNYIAIPVEMSYAEKVYWDTRFFFTDEYRKKIISQNSLFYLGSTVFLTIVISVSLFFIINRLIITPIKTTTGMLKNISEGKGDLTRNINFKTDDELGKLARYFNDFINSLGNIVRNVKSVIGKTKNISHKLAASSQESSSAMEEISNTVKSINEKISYLDKQISFSGKSSGEVKEFISGTVDLIMNQSSAITESTASIEEMSSSIKNIAIISEEKLKIMKELEGIASSGAEDMQKTIEIINKVTDSANVIMGMIEVINNIASQTNLLAINAAIEAAHAGEKGKGFSVVASEIRKLAESTAVNSKDISSSLKNVIAYIHESEETTDSTRKSFSNIVDKINRVSGGMLEMEEGMGELAANSHQIMISLRAIIETTANVRESSAKMNEEIAKITESLGRLENISFETKGGMQEIELGIKEVFAESEDVSKSGMENERNINELEALVSQFRTE